MTSSSQLHRGSEESILSADRGRMQGLCLFSESPGLVDMFGSSEHTADVAGAGTREHSTCFSGSHWFV